MREKLQRLTLVDERCLKKNMMAHQIKVNFYSFLLIFNFLHSIIHANFSYQLVLI